ncbi:VQ motif-containing protein 4-like [Phragmites australis]|uniref:VQ motif-containing protein 4-like n=1 Tax=Phragmites australis TaxID=29695 RepID=UPI002D78A915|nr:VQ motif-containing protein 4-like [Phragmites australis]
MEVAAAKQLPMARDPNSPSSSTSSSPPSSAASPSRQQPQPSPKPVPRVIETTPFPTTFVQADTASFKQVVQMLTGADMPPPSSQKPVKNHHHGGSGLAGGQSGVPCRPKKPAFKLYERRSGLKNLKMIAPLATAAAAAAGASSRKTPEVLSPSVLDFPSLGLGSPVTPLVIDPFNRSPASASPGEKDEAAERTAIARKGFFLHPSPRGADPPRLLPLFPVTSPRMASAGAAAAPSFQ